MNQARIVVTYASLALGGVCFLIYLAASVRALRIPASPPNQAFADRARSLVAEPDLSIGEFTKLLEALAKVADGLTKAGPALTALIGALLFFAIAALSSGALS